MKLKINKRLVAIGSISMIAMAVISLVYRGLLGNMDNDLFNILVKVVLIFSCVAYVAGFFCPDRSQMKAEHQAEDSPRSEGFLAKLCSRKRLRSVSASSTSACCLTRETDLPIS